MESIDLDMGDLFDNEAVGDDEDVGAHASHPYLDDDDGRMREPGEDGEGGDSQQDGEEGVVENLQRLSKGAAKKRVMRPQPKLDPDRLKSERGIPILPRLFEPVKFKGKGHEMDDLKVMMGKLEHWAHRLFPKMPFDDFTDRLEKLGAKKAVQTCVSRIRMDMPILDDEYIAMYTEGDRADGDPEDAEQQDVAASPRRDDGEADFDAKDAFEEMMRQEREARERRQLELGASDGEGHEGTPSKRSNSWTDAASSPHQSQDGRRSEPQSSKNEAEDVSQVASREAMGASQGSQGASQCTQAAAQGSQTASKGMTPDARARIEENKRKAMERRAARLGVPVSALMSPAATPNKVTTLDASSNETTVKAPESQEKQSPVTSQHETTANDVQTPPASSKVDGNSNDKKMSDPTSERVESPAVDNSASERQDEKVLSGTLSAFKTNERKDETSIETPSAFSESQEDLSQSEEIRLQGQICNSQSDSNLTSTVREIDSMDIDQAMETLEAESEVIPYQGKELPGKENLESLPNASKEHSESSKLCNNEQNVNED